MILSWARVAIVSLLVLHVAGCAYVGEGDVTSPIFCTAPQGAWTWAAYVQGVLLLVTAPLLVVSFFVARLRYVGIIVGVLSLAGLIGQHVLLDRGQFYCDAP